MLDRLKQINVDAASLEELVYLVTIGKNMQAEYAEQEIAPPEWLGLRVKELQRQVAKQNSDLMEKRLRELKARRETLDDAATRRRKIDAEIKKLEAVL